MANELSQTYGRRVYQMRETGYLMFPLTEWRPHQDWIFGPEGRFDVFPKITISCGDRVLFSGHLPIGEKSEGRLTYLNMGMCEGKEFVLESDDDAALDKIEFTESIDKAALYAESHRPLIHYSYLQGCMGDIMSLTYYQGVWHFFSIYNPLEGYEISWGHATSRDLVHWEEQPPLFFDNYLVYNGCTVVDRENVLGLNQNGHEAIVIFIPQIGRGISCFISTDGGKHFEEGEVKNPIVPYGDAPRLYYSREDRYWVMHVKKDFRLIHEYRSYDLRKWTYIRDVPAVAEMVFHEGDPGEMFDMYIDNDPEKRVAVIHYGLGGFLLTQYREEGFVNPDGTLATYNDLILDYHYGYPVHFVNAPDNRLIAMWNIGNAGYGGIPNFTYDYRHIASFPVEVTLRTTPEGLRIFRYPVKEIENLYGAEYMESRTELSDGEKKCLPGKGKCFFIKATFQNKDASAFGFSVNGRRVRYDAAKECISLCDDENCILAPLGNAATEGGDARRPLEASAPLRENCVTLSAITDINSLEAFAEDGYAYLGVGHLNLTDLESRLYAFSEGGSCTLVSCEIHELTPIH